MPRTMGASSSPTTALLAVLTLLALAGRLDVAAGKGAGKAAAAAAGDQQAAQTYIIVFKQGAGAEYVRAACTEAEAPAGRFSGTCRHKFLSGLIGFSGTFTPSNLDELLEAYADMVDYVEPDTPLHVTGAAAPDWATADALPAAPRPAEEDRDLRLRAVERAREELRRRRLAEQDQISPTWNLDRIDQRTAALDSVYHYEATGTGVNVYVLDTGIRGTHEEFRLLFGGGEGSRVQPGFSVFDDEDGGASDYNGHGTHTAAIIGGLSYGVAKNVTLWPVKVMDCNGASSMSSMLAALEWVAANHRPPAVLSMSVAGDLSLAVNEAVRRLVESHMITVVVAAGNGYAQACEVSPASAPAALTVGASDQFDRRWARSNWGPCVDLHAPGVDVLSASNDSSTGTLIKSGTSMACPHVSGVVALYLEQHPGASPQEIRLKLNSAAESVLRDDVEGYGTFDPWGNPQSLDVTSTPKRLVYALLPSQATFTPGIVRVTMPPKTLTIQLRLESRPASPVNISVVAPTATWSGTRLARPKPDTFAVAPAAWDQPQLVSLTPAALANGDYHVSFYFTSQDANFSNAMQTVKVLDGRNLTGESLQDPRIIPGLPFVDVEDSSRFSDQYSLAGRGRAGASAPDVAYLFRPAASVDVDISTCGSTFDTELFLLEDPASLQVFLTNDDDPQCASNPRNSRISTRLQAGRAYYLLVDGYSSGWISAQGQYRLSITARLGAQVKSAAN